MPRVVVDFGGHTDHTGQEAQHIVMDAHGVVVRVRGTGVPLADDPLLARIVYDDAARDAATGQCGVILRKQPGGGAMSSQPIFEYSVVRPFVEAYQRRVKEAAAAEQVDS